MITKEMFVKTVTETGEVFTPATLEEVENTETVLYALEKDGTYKAVEALPPVPDEPVVGAQKDADIPDPVVSAIFAPSAEEAEEVVSEPTEDERFSALVETTVDILHSKGWAFGNELQELINRFK